MIMDSFKTIPATIFNNEIRGLYSSFEKDYLDNVPVVELSRKYGHNYYKRLYRELVARGIPPRIDRENPKHYHYSKRSKSYIVMKRINGKTVHFGSFKNEDEAKALVEELKKNNWKKIKKE